MQVSKVLVVDGDRTARDTLVTCLQFVGVEAHGAECAVAARFWLATGSADVLVVSDELANGGFVELVEHCGRETPLAKASILMLTRGASTVTSNYPVDATLTRPVALSRVVERIESLIDERRAQDRRLLSFGALTLDVPGARVQSGEHVSVLGRTETRLLAFFIGVPDKVFSRARLLEKLWPSNVRVEERTVDVHIRRLRLALENLGCAHYIQTVRGSGYRFSRHPG